MGGKLTAIEHPAATEYAPYYGRYISLVTGNDLLASLEQQAKQTVAELKKVSEGKVDYRYAPGKWSVKEVLGHINDTERIFAYRALRISRNDKTPIEGYEQDDYVRFGPFQHCRFQDLVEEFALIRKSTLFLLRGLDSGAWLRRGTANKMEISVRAIAYVIAGHELHHMKILRQQYLELPS